jgi:large subunit ribosomal protein L21
MLAVIKTGGKQYLVSPGQKIKIEKLDAKEGSDVTFPEVLLLERDGKADIGLPLVESAKVSGKVIRQGRGEKLIVFKYKAKKRYHLKKGHRQSFTEIEITGI